MNLFNGENYNKRQTKAAIRKRLRETKDQQKDGKELNTYNLCCVLANDHVRTNHVTWYNKMSCKCQKATGKQRPELTNPNMNSGLNIYTFNCPPGSSLEILHDFNFSLPNSAELSSIVLVGGVNLPPINWSTDLPVSLSAGSHAMDNIFCELIDDNFLPQFITGPTHISGSTLDLIVSFNECCWCGHGLLMVNIFRIVMSQTEYIYLIFHIFTFFIIIFLIPLDLSTFRWQFSTIKFFFN